MEHLVYASVILGGIALFAFLWNQEHNMLRRVSREKEEIEIEEHRMFDFLHGLGVELQNDSSPPNMHRYIVNGVPTVVDGDAAVLYLVDDREDLIIPVSLSEKTTPILRVPEELRKLSDREEASHKYRAHIRLTPLKPGDGIIGRALKCGSVFRIDNLGDYLEPSSNYFHDKVSLLAAPLIYANKKIGVIAVTRNGGIPFNSNDRDVFGSVTEQCSFALGSAIIHAEAFEKRRLERELAQASEIQRILLPKSNPELSDYRLAATYRAARHVSGDYYDYVKVDGDHYGVAIADVCGKGIAASLIVAMCRAALRSNCGDNLSPSSVLHHVNSSIFPDIREDMFVSFLYLILERGSDVIRFASAGHEPPYIRRIDSGKLEAVESSGLAVGVDKGSVFERAVKDHQFTMEPGDILILYTDGLIEALNREGEEYGIERFEKSLEDAEGLSAPEILDSILSDNEKFTKGTHAVDDITLIALEKR